MALALFFATLLSGCQSTPEDGLAATSEINTENAYQNALEMHKNWQQKMMNIDHLALYSPNKFNALQSGWKKADLIYLEFSDEPDVAFENYSIFSSTTYLERFFDEIHQAQLILTDLERLKVQADNVLEPAIEQMRYLNSLGAQQYYRSEYTRLNRLYAKLFRLVEQEVISDAREEQDEFLERSHSLEVKTVKKIYIAPLESELRSLRQKDVKYYAPLSYARVESEIGAGNTVIDLSPRDFTTINKAVTEIQFELDHAAHIALEVQSLRDRSKDEYENFILDIEAKLLRISRALNDEDLRNKPMRTQAQLITDGVATARQQRAVKSITAQQDPAKDQQIQALTLLVENQKQVIQQLRAKIVSQPDSYSAPYQLKDVEQTDPTEQSMPVVVATDLAEPSVEGTLLSE
ncbi:hypothetical protein C9I89_00900 [Photobacterium lipolyticum]|uniref:ATPase n=1 Tax=Photobacterium lipolyticum TaxID=266810 RepID=A0A2T3N4E8_9GAMM|nr:hypothetical protein C9I89_00900 [Photobacterium lipolyticum]